MLFSKASGYLAGIFITTALLRGVLQFLAQHVIVGQSTLNNPQPLVPLGWLSIALALLLNMLSLVGWSLVGWSIERLRADRLAGD
ncbi:hypothetical protein OM427_27925 [Halomonas sp. 18H]|uniref:hypothetical protein n=1 Tax=Halomonas almeriensis TaxID=308163 RepID=UPI0022308025|nr:MULTISPECIES: hypothetical protein [Halomonas]MCW4153347.1 hypothetical protein [Halomonas sp. 18H]MDN3553774.1 hypothetical protein [Halomonas almeriensis]